MTGSILINGPLCGEGVLQVKEDSVYFQMQVQGTTPLSLEDLLSDVRSCLKQEHNRETLQESVIQLLSAAEKLLLLKKSQRMEKKENDPDKTNG